MTKLNNPNLIDKIDQLSHIGQTTKGICRKSGTREDANARGLVISWMLNAGMSVQQDEYNNLIGTLSGNQDLPPIVVGSHIDTVETAGKYDGVLGVLAGIEAADTLRGHLNHPLQVVVFNDEENSMSGSVGYCSDKPNIRVFLELHVEQGPVLDLQQTDIGVVQGIVGQRRCHFTMYGQENHAGTTPMSMRDDALVKTAPVISYVYEKALEAGGLVATVSQLEVSPNAFSVVPGQVDFTIQVRDLSADTMEEFVEDVCKKFDLRYDIAHTSEPTECDVNVMRIINDTANDLGLSSMELPSRASHDAQNFTFCPMGMIFVPSIDGISHSPDEKTTDEMCYNGLNVLTETIRRIDVEA